MTLLTRRPPSPPPHPHPHPRPTSRCQVCIAEALRVSHHIRELDLSNNAFTHVGAQDVAAALGENASVSSVKLRENALGNAGVSAILSAVVSNQASRVECVDCR